jgi:broad specificity phosphatase PhoE
MRDLYLVRHGQAAGGPSGMDRDFFLTKEGTAQANALGRNLKEAGVSVDLIYASRLTRARQTAEIVTRYVPAPIEVREDLIEHGSSQFLLDCSIEEAARLRPESLSPEGELRISPGAGHGLNWQFAVGGETLRALHERAAAAYRAIVTAHPGPDFVCMVVAHGSFLSAMLTEALGLPLRGVWNFQLANAGFLHLRLYARPDGELPAPAVCIHGPDGRFPEP